MRASPPANLNSLSASTATFRAPPDPNAQDEDSHSSSSNSPTRPDYEESDFFAGNNDSNSSIGIPTFDAMSVGTEPAACLPPINRLPAEILINIFNKLNTPSDLLNCLLTSKSWARNCVDLLWLRPACTTWPKHGAICRTLILPDPYFAYRDFVKRLNLAGLADRVNDGSVLPLAACTRVERLTLTSCVGLTDQGLIGLVSNNKQLLALDISGDVNITEAAIDVLAENCRILQGLNVSGCIRISNEAMIRVAQNCKKLKRLKLNDCHQLEDAAVIAFAKNCPNILEIDLHQCRLIGNEPITSLLSMGRCLRELRLANCELISDSAFTSLPPGQVFEHLRILDLTSCARLTDRAVEKIVSVAPRLRNLVLAKCRNITDVAVNAISKLGKNLHYVHLGHCSHITDDAVKTLVQYCARIRYIDLGCCVRLTDASVTKLATLPKLRRIGLVKCHLITDESVYALSQSYRRIPSGEILFPSSHGREQSSLERVHLSYCTNLTLRSILVLLNNCPRLTHLSLTGVEAFLREDLEQFCRDAPPEFNQHQRDVFCVFSGQGVHGLRKHLNAEARLQSTRELELDEDETTLREPSVGYGVINGHLNVGNMPGAFDDGEGDGDGDDAGDGEGDEELDDGGVTISPGEGQD